MMVSEAVKNVVVVVVEITDGLDVINVISGQSHIRQELLFIHLRESLRSSLGFWGGAFSKF